MYFKHEHLWSFAFKCLSLASTCSSYLSISLSRYSCINSWVLNPWLFCWTCSNVNLILMSNHTIYLLHYVDMLQDQNMTLTQFIQTIYILHSLRGNHPFVEKFFCGYRRLFELVEIPSAYSIAQSFLSILGIHDFTRYWDTFC